MEHRNDPRLLLRRHDGTALIEFAIAAPVLVTLLVGMIGYGQHFLLAHSAQQIANDAARAAIAGITPVERTAIVDEVAAEGAAAIGVVGPGRVDADADEIVGRIHVRVTIDASDLGILRLPIVPMPSPIIVRSAMTRLGDGP